MGYIPLPCTPAVAGRLAGLVLPYQTPAGGVCTKKNWYKPICRIGLRMAASTVMWLL